MECCKCTFPFQDHDAYFELLPCSATLFGDCHVLCPSCFGELHAERGCNPTPSCPQCRAPVTGHRCHQRKLRPGRGERPPRLDPVVSRGEAIHIAEPNPELDPLRAFASETGDYIRSNLCFSVGWCSSESYINALTINVPFDAHCDSYNEQTKSKLESLMTLLHHVFYNNDENENQPVNIMSIKDTFNLAIADSSSLALRACVALGSGRRLETLLPAFDDPSNVPQRNNFLSFWVAHQMMKRCTIRGTTTLQSFMGHQLAIWKANGNLVDLLSALRVSSSHRCTRIKDIKAVNDKILEGIDMKEKKWGITQLAYDNLGFRKRGANCGYLQYTLLQLHFLSPDALKRLGFYLPRGSNQTPISRERKSWDAIKGNCTESDILPSDEDYCRLADHLYSHIDALLEIINSIPTIDEARNLLETHGRNFDLETKLTTRYNMDVPRQPQGSGVETEAYEEEESDGEDEDEEPANTMTDPCLGTTTASMYDVGQQQVEMDLPMKADLNKKSTVRNIMEGALDLRLRALSGDSTMDTDERPLMEDLGIFTGGDNSPHFTYLGLKAANPERLKFVTDHCGGFHEYLNGKKKHGLKFGDSHVKYMIDPVRDTDKKKDWYLNPGDPGQTAIEEPERTDAHYVSAARKLSKLRRGAPISAVDVDDHMLNRARQHDQAMIVLADLRCVEISNMLRDSEKRGDEGDVELFRSGSKLSLLLFAKTNAIKYIRTAIEYWIWWQTSSAADKVIYKAFLFTKKSGKNGLPIWVDRFHEWMNEDVRKYLGKHAQPNQDALLTRITMTLRSRRGIKSEYGELFTQGGGGENDRQCLGGSLAISPIFCHQLIIADKLNLWGDGPVQVGSYKHDIFEDATEFTDPSGREQLNTRILFDVTAAEASLKDFFRQNYLQEEDEGSNNEMDNEQESVPTSFRLTPVFLKDVKQARSNEVTRRTSTSSKSLDSICTKTYLRLRWESLEQRFDFVATLQVPTRPKNNDKKDLWTDAVAQLHSRIIERVPNFVEMEETAIQDASLECGGLANAEEKAREMERPFYALPQNVRDVYAGRQYQVKYDCNSSDRDGNDEAPNDDIGGGNSSDDNSAFGIADMSINESPAFGNGSHSAANEATPFFARPHGSSRLFTPMDDEEIPPTPTP